MLAATVPGLALVAACLIVAARTDQQAWAVVAVLLLAAVGATYSVWESGGLRPWLRWFAVTAGAMALVAAVAIVVG